ncbi:MAG TPA: methyltransferase domain-containing protein, partial [Jatrophihabitans sp.]|nr:methyltransferase domain-containing protein [Jatrophihabitans sp.]
SSHAVGEGLVEMAAPAPGESVLELAAGPGDTGFLAAELVGEGGRLVSTDLSTQMLAAAERRAAELGLTTGGRLLWTRPWHQPADWISALLAPLAVGGSTVLVGNPDDSLTDRRLVAERITVRH